MHLVEAAPLELGYVRNLDAGAVLHADQPLGAELAQHAGHLG